MSDWHDAEQIPPPLYVDVEISRDGGLTVCDTLTWENQFQTANINRKGMMWRFAGGHANERAI